jgi:hypothetical protein
MAITTSSVKGKEEVQAKEPLDKAKEAGAQAADKAKEAAACVGEMATQAACAVGKKADDLTSDAGSSVRHWGEAMSDKGPQQGVLGHASHAVAETLKEGGRYIEEAKLSGMFEDLGQLIRRNPIPALFVGFGCGFLLGRAMRS